MVSHFIIHTALYDTVSYDNILCCTIPYYTVRYYSMPYSVITITKPRDSTAPTTAVQHDQDVFSVQKHRTVSKLQKTNGYTRPAHDTKSLHRDNASLHGLSLSEYLYVNAAVKTELHPWIGPHALRQST